MLSCRLQCALAALSIVLALGGVTAAPSDPRLRQFLQKSLAAAAGKQVRRLPRRFLSSLWNPSFLSLAPASLGGLNRCSRRVSVLFWVSQLSKLLGKLSKSRIPSYHFLSPAPPHPLISTAHHRWVLGHSRKFRVLGNWAGRYGIYPRCWPWEVLTQVLKQRPSDSATVLSHTSFPCRGWGDNRYSTDETKCI